MSLPPAAYRTAFEGDPDGLVIFDPETGRICECNERFAELLESDCETLRDRGVTDVVTTGKREVGVTPNDETETVDWTIRTESGATLDGEARLSTVTLDGEDRILARVVDESVQRVTNASGQRVTDTSERTERLERLERRARAIDEAPIGITMSAPDREDNPLIYVNEGFQRLTGYAEGEVLGRNCRFLQGDLTDPEPVAQMREAIDAERPVTTELRNYRKDGSMFWNRVTIAPVRDGDGELVNFVGFQEDVTDRKRSERELAFASRLLETIPIGILRTTSSPEATFEYANPALVSLLGADSIGDLRERRVVDIYPDPDHREQLVDDLAEADGPIQRETTLATLDGEEREVLITASLFEDETGAEYVHKIVQDITERKRYERQIKEQRDDLTVLNQMLRHDIRNDLQVVTAYAGILEDYVDEQGAEYLEQIQSAAANAVELTRTAREMADVMLSTEKNRNAVSLRSALEEELDDVRSEHSEAAITVEGAIPATRVLADDMLGSVFRNLLTNAVQHNDKEVPEVRVSVEEREGAVTVRVADNGPGIPDGQKESIFGKGEKGLESGGTGIGLYLVETLVGNYGGSVRVEDNDPEGSVFVVELPRAAQTE